MRVTFDRRHDVLVLRAEGVLDPVTSPVLHGAVGKALAEQPDSLVCDLTALNCAALRHLALLFVLSDLTADWPSVHVVVACSPGLADQMRRLGLHRRIAFDTSLDQAITDARRRVRPPHTRMLRLDSAERRARLAREFAADVCLSWGLAGTAEDARLVVNELVVHALRIGLEPTEVQLALQVRSVYVLVRSRPASRDPDDASPGQRQQPLATRFDLPLVESLSRGWGGHPTHDGGELLWCRVGRVAAAPDGEPAEAWRGLKKGL